MGRRASRRGFTLLEVLVAVAILGLGLTVILSAQFSVVSGATHTRHMSVALGLGRCKMSEVEQELTIEGFPAVDSEGNGACCEGNNSPNITCSWRVERPAFPTADYGKLDLDSDLDQSPLGSLAETAKKAKGATDPTSVGDIAADLAGGSGGVGGIAATVMTMVYPDLKAMFEASTRKITIVLTWTEGNRAYDILLTQWVTQPQQGVVVPEGEEEDDTGASSGSSGSTGSGASTGSGTTR